MSQADELLESLASETSEYENIVIGYDRYIIVPEALKRLAVQYDHNVETVTFDCPRYLDGHDMSVMQIYINYIRPDGIRGSHLCTNVGIDAIDDEVVHFDWTISGHVTYSDGYLSFMVCIKEVDSDGNEVIHWNSEINNETYISPGIKCPDTILTQYPDVIAQLFTRIEALENTIASLTEEG